MQITDLTGLVERLPAERRARFERIFDVQMVEGRCEVPPAMRAWVTQRFGSVEDVERQQMVRVTNKVTWEGAVFNPLRARRPMPMNETNIEHAAPKDDIFATPLTDTAADMFGRIQGEHCVTASNVARWDGQCAVLIFDEPDPLAFTRDHLRDYFRTARRWAERAHQADPQARYLIWMWNGGPAGGASIPHAHAQLGLARSSHYAMVEGLRRAALGYRAQYGTNYFDDLYAAHADVGLGFTRGSVRGLVSLSAVRAGDMWLLAPAFNDALADALHDVLRTYVERAQLRGFDIAVLMPPLYEPQTREVCETSRVSLVEDWSGFPVIARMVDRGAPGAVSSDFGAMDIFAQRVIGADPYATRETLRFDEN
jgi:hypothetical protein